MRVAFLVPSFPAISETFILRQITGLIDLGHEVDIYAERRPAESAAVHQEVLQYRLLDKTVYTDGSMPPATGLYEMPVWPFFGETWLPGATDPIPNWRRWAEATGTLAYCLGNAPLVTREVLNPREYGYQARSLSALYRLATILAQKRSYDVAHAHFGPQANTFRFAKSLWRVPFVASFHGFDFCTLPRQQGTAIYDRLFETADAITVNSSYTKDRLIDLGCPAAKIRNLPVGLDPQLFSARWRCPEGEGLVRLLSIGRLVPIKGHEYAIRAVAKLRERHPSLRYDIVGEGPQRSELEALVRQLNLTGIVNLRGALTGDGVQEALSAAHIFLMCSVEIEGDAEGQGLALQEAQACAIPVVATRHGALPEGLLPGKSGLLVPERDAEALAGAIESLLADAERCREMGRAGREFVSQRYDIRRLNNDLVDIYRDLIRARARK